MKKEKIELWKMLWKDKNSPPQKVGWDVSRLSLEEKDLLAEWIKSTYNLRCEGRFGKEKGLIINLFSETFSFYANFTSPRLANGYSSMNEYPASFENAKKYIASCVDDWL